MPTLYNYIGDCIRRLRLTHFGKPVSQASLASAIGTTSNTVSRWETAIYKPSLADLEKVAHFFGVSISLFVSQEEIPSKLQALLAIAGNLDDEELEELTCYALFRSTQRR